MIQKISIAYFKNEKQVFSAYQTSQIDIEKQGQNAFNQLVKEIANKHTYTGTIVSTAGIIHELETPRQLQIKCLDSMTNTLSEQELLDIITDYYARFKQRNTQLFITQAFFDRTFHILVLNFLPIYVRPTTGEIQIHFNKALQQQLGYTETAQKMIEDWKDEEYQQFSYIYKQAGYQAEDIKALFAEQLQNHLDGFYRSLKDLKEDLRYLDENSAEVELDDETKEAMVKSANEAESLFTSYNDLSQSLQEKINVLDDTNERINQSLARFETLQNQLAERENNLQETLEKITNQTISLDEPDKIIEQLAKTLQNYEERTSS